MVINKHFAPALVNAIDLMVKWMYVTVYAGGTLGETTN